MKKLSIRPKPKIAKAVWQKSITYVLAGFGLVTALAWNEAIKSLFEMIFGKSRGTLIAKFSYAIVLTFIIVLLSMKLSKWAKKKR